MPHHEEEVIQNKDENLKGESTVGGEPTEVTPTIGEIFAGISATKQKSLPAGYKGVTDPELITALTRPIDFSLDPRFKSTLASQRFEDEKASLGVKYQDALLPDQAKSFFRDSEAKGIVDYKLNNYDKAFKQFLDDLDDSESAWRDYLGWFPNLIGQTLHSIGTLVPMTYGVFEAVFAGDFSRIFDNTFYNEYKEAGDWFQKKMVQYEDSDQFKYSPQDSRIFANLNVLGVYDEDELRKATKRSQKTLAQKFIANPGSAFNNQVVPTIAFLADVVLTETLAGMATVATGGSAGYSIAANTARLAARGETLFSKGWKYLKGAELIKDAEKLKELQSLSKKYYRGTDTLMSVVRSSATESGLIAHSTQERVYETLVNNYEKTNGKSPSEQIKNEFREQAKSAGTTAYLINTPLVGFSNLIGIPKLMQRNLANARILNRLKGSAGIDIVEDATTGALKAESRAGSKLYRTYDIGKSFAITGFTEAFEEFSQGVLEEGLIDYHLNNNSYNASADKISFVGAMRRNALPYLESVEGQDSVLLGGLMGLIGLPMPIRVNAQNRIEGGFQWHGGAAERLIQLKQDVNLSQQVADQINQDGQASIKEYFSSNQNITKTNMDEMIAHKHTQESIDEELKKANPNTYKIKNKEGDQAHSLFLKYHLQNIEPVLFKEIEAMEKMPLDVFNKHYAPADNPFTQEEKDNQLSKLKSKAEANFKEFAKVKDYVEYNSLKYSFNKIDKIINKKEDLEKELKKANDPKTAEKIKKKIDKVELIKRKIVAQRIKENHIGMLYYLHSASLDADHRLNTLNKEIGEILEEGQGEFIPEFLKSRGILSYADIEVYKEGEQAGILISKDYELSKQEQLKNALDEWKKSDPDSFNKYSEQVKPLLKDIINLKSRKKAAGEFIKLLETDKGFEKFVLFEKEILDKFEQDHIENSKDYISRNGNETNNAETAKSFEKDSVTATGSTEIVDGKILEDVEKGLQVFNDNIVDNEELSTTEKHKAIKEILDKYPRLYGIIKDKLKNKGLNIKYKTVDELARTEGYDSPIFEFLYNELANVNQFFIKEGSAGIKIMVTNQQHIAPNNTNLDDINQSELKGEQSIEAEFQSGKGKTTTENWTILTTNDSEFDSRRNIVYEAHRTEKGEVVLRPKKHDSLIGSEFANIPLELINSAEFLNNIDLEAKNHNIIFKISNNKYNETYLDKNGALIKNDSIYQMAIGAYYINEAGEEILIGLVPTFNTKNNSQQLKKLREDIFERHIKMEEIDIKLSKENKEFASLKEKLEEAKEALRNSIFEKGAPEEAKALKKIEKLQSQLDKKRRELAVETVGIDPEIQELVSKKEALQEEQRQLKEESKAKKAETKPEVTAEETKKVDIEKNISDTEASLENLRNQLDNAKSEEGGEIEVPYKPKAVVLYPRGRDVKNATTSPNVVNISLFRLEMDSENSTEGLIYFEPDATAFKRALNFSDSNILPYFEEANDWGKKTVNWAGIKTITPTKVRIRKDGHFEVIEKGLIEYVDTPMTDKSLSRPTTVETKEGGKVEVPYKPKASIRYIPGIGYGKMSNIDDIASAQKKTNISLLRLEMDSQESTSGLLYFDPELEMGFGRAMNTPESNFSTSVFHEANEFDINAKGIKTIEPAEVKIINGNLEVIKKGLIEYVNTPMSNKSLSRPTTVETREKAPAETINNLENQISQEEAKLKQLQDELAALEDKSAKTTTDIEAKTTTEEDIKQLNETLKEVEEELKNAKAETATEEVVEDIVEEEIVEEKEIENPIDSAIEDLKETLDKEENPNKAKVIQEQIENLEKTPTPEKMEEILDNEVTEEDTKAIAEEENITEEEVRDHIKKTLKEHIKEFGNKLIKAPKTRLKKVINKILKGIVGLFIGGTLVVTGASFGFNENGELEFKLENAVDNLLPDEQAEWAKRYLDKEGIIDIEDVKFVVNDTPPVIKETPKPEKIFEVIGSVKDNYTSSDSLLSYRSQWDNADGFRYIPAPVKQDLPKGGMKFSGVIGVGHFLLDASVAQNKEYSHQNNKAYLRKAKENNDWVPAFTRNNDGSVTLKYKRAKEISSKDLVVSPLRQMSFSDINFGKTKTPEGFKSSIKEVTKKDGSGTYLIFKDRDGYSRFSGGSVVFIFNDKHGNTIIRDFAGTINQIQKEGQSITSQYNLKEGALTIGYHDVGSFSAKPKSKGGTISTEQWAGFNNEGMTGGALMIPIEGNTTPSKAPVDKSSLGFLGLALLGNLKGFRRKKQKGQKITEQDIQGLQDLKEEIENKIKEVEASLVAEPKVPTQSQDNLKRLKEIQSEIADINKKLRGKKVNLDTDLSIRDSKYGKLLELEFKLKNARSERKKAPIQKELEKLKDEIGEIELERIKSIENNFENIIEQIAARQINIFYKENEIRKC